MDDMTAVRRAVDRLLAATSPTDSLYPEILYTQAMVANSAADMRRDLQRVVVEYPTSSWTDDALLRLVQMDYATRSFEAAARNLERRVPGLRGSRRLSLRRPGRGARRSDRMRARPRSPAWPRGLSLLPCTNRSRSRAPGRRLRRRRTTGEHGRAHLCRGLGERLQRQLHGRLQPRPTRRQRERDRQRLRDRLLQSAGCVQKSPLSPARWASASRRCRSRPRRPQPSPPTRARASWRPALP